jgi:hypothetical protein
VSLGGKGVPRSDNAHRKEKHVFRNPSLLAVIVGAALVAPLRAEKVDMSPEEHGKTATHVVLARNAYGGFGFDNKDGGLNVIGANGFREVEAGFKEVTYVSLNLTPNKQLVRHAPR